MNPTKMWIVHRIGDLPIVEYEYEAANAESACLSAAKSHGGRPKIWEARKENGVITKYRRLEEEGKLTREQIIVRLTDYSCSLTLGRNFCETMEDYESRRPDIVQFEADKLRVYGF